MIFIMAKKKKTYAKDLLDKMVILKSERDTFVLSKKIKMDELNSKISIIEAEIKAIDKETKVFSKMKNDGIRELKLEGELRKCGGVEIIKGREFFFNSEDFRKNESLDPIINIGSYTLTGEFKIIIQVVDETKF